MGGRWGWAEAIRERHFTPTLPGGYALERVDHDTYWDRHEAELREHFPQEAYFDGAVLSGDERAAARERLAAAEGADRLSDHWFVHAPDGTLAGSARPFSATPTRSSSTTSRSAPTIAGAGYRELLERVLAYAGELGFSTTVSKHAPSNNAVLIRHRRPASASSRSTSTRCTDPRCCSRTSTTRSS